MGSKWRWLLISLGGVLFALTIVGIFDVRYYFFDEPIYIDAAQALVDGEEVRNWEHPPLGKYLIVAGRSLAPDKVIGARIPGLVSLLLLLGFLGLIAERTFRGRAAAGLAGAAIVLLALTDPLLVNLSKVAMLEVYVLSFTVAAIYFAVRYFEEGGTGSVVAMGVFSGLAIATKWSAVPVLAVFFAYLLWRNRKLAVVGAAIALGIYVCSFLPYLALHHARVGWGDIWDLHRSMFEFHRGFNFVYPHQSPWWSWPILFRPVWLLAETREQNTQGLFLVGNVITYFAGPVGLAWWASRRSDWRGLLFLAGYLSTLVFWALAGRRTYFYYYLMCAPFLYLGALYLMGEMFKRRVWLGYALASSVLLVFALYYPIVRFLPFGSTYFSAAFFPAPWQYIFH